MQPAAILDIGTSKAVCLCGSSVHTDGIVIHGVGVSGFSGFSGSSFEDPASFKEAVLSAVESAEREACKRIRDVAVSVPAVFTKLAVTDAEIKIENRNRKIVTEDVEDVISLSLEKASVPGYMLMHSTPVSFRAGGEILADFPVDVRSTSLGATVSHMYANTDFIRTLEDILSSIHVEISMLVSAQLAEAVHIIPESERVRPSFLIDVGYARTDICRIENAAVTALTSLEIGGSQFASDLSFGLDIPPEYGEVVKRRYTFLQEPLSRVDVIRMPSGPKRVDHHVIDLVMEARMKELCKLIREALAEMDCIPENRPVIYLTGGGIAMVRGSGEFMKQELQMPVRRDMPSYMHEMNTANYTSAFGALDFVLRATGNEEASSSAGDTVADRIKKFLNK